MPIHLAVAVSLLRVAPRPRERTGCPLSPVQRGQSRLTFETLVTRLFRDGVQFCSGLVDLVVCVGHNLGGGHRLTLAGERFVGLVAEHITKVSDRSADLRDRRRGEGIERETCNGRRRFMASEPVEEGGEHHQGYADHGGVAGLVVVADGHSDVIERSRRVAVLGLERGQTGRQDGLDGAVAAVLSDRQSPAAGIPRAVGVGVAEREPVGGKGICERIGVAGGLGGVDQAGRGGSRLLTGTGASPVRIRWLSW